MRGSYVLSECLERSGYHPDTAPEHRAGRVRAYPSNASQAVWMRLQASSSASVEVA